MTLQDVADALREAEVLADALPDTPERYAVIAQLQRTYTKLLACSSELQDDIGLLLDVTRSLDALGDTL